MFLRKMLARSLAIAVVILVPGNVASGPREDQAFAEYDRYCLRGMTDPKQIPEMLQEAKGKPLPPLAASQFLGQAGRVWLMKNKQLSFTAFLTDTGACGLKFSGVDYETVQAVFERSTNSLQVERDDDKNQILTTYATRVHGAEPDGDTLLLALLLAGKFGADKSAVVMSSIPKEAMDSAGMHAKWPR